MSRAALLMTAAAAQRPRPEQGALAVYVYALDAEGEPTERSGFYEVDVETGHATLAVPYIVVTPEGRPTLFEYLGFGYVSALHSFVEGGSVTVKVSRDGAQVVGGGFPNMAATRFDKTLAVSADYTTNQTRVLSGTEGGPFWLPDIDPLAFPPEFLHLSDAEPYIAQVQSTGGDVEIYSAHGAVAQVAMDAPAAAGASSTEGRGRSDQLDWHPQDPLLTVATGGVIRTYRIESGLASTVDETPIGDVEPGLGHVDNVFWDGGGEHLHLTIDDPIAGTSRVITLAWDGEQILLPPTGDVVVDIAAAPYRATQVRRGDATFFCRSEPIAGSGTKPGTTYRTQGGALTAESTIAAGSGENYGPDKVAAPAMLDVFRLFGLTQYEGVVFTEGGAKFVSVTVEPDPNAVEMHIMGAVELFD